MTIYVDQFPEGWGKWTGGGHMLTTNIFELHDMARKIGLKKQWFQKDGRFPHYDVQRRKRALAIQHGAVEIEIGEIPDDVLVKNPHDGGWRKYGDRRVQAS